MVEIQALKRSILRGLRYREAARKGGMFRWTRIPDLFQSSLLMGQWLGFSSLPPEARKISRISCYPSLGLALSSKEFPRRSVKPLTTLNLKKRALNLDSRWDLRQAN